MNIPFALSNLLPPSQGQDQASTASTSSNPALTTNQVAGSGATGPGSEPEALSELQSLSNSAVHDDEEHVFSDNLDLAVQELLLKHARAVDAAISTAAPAPSDPALFTPPSSPPLARPYRPPPHRMPPSLTRPGGIQGLPSC